MSRGFLVAFTAVTAFAVAGVDYVNESHRAGLPVGRMGAGAYVATITGRVDAGKAAARAGAERAALLAQRTRDHLPAAPDGWVRRDWTEADHARLYQAPGAAPAALPGDIAGLDPAGGVNAHEIWVYERDGALVAVRLRRAVPQAGGALGFTQTAMTMVMANINAMSDRSGFAVVQGVPFLADAGTFGDLADAPFRLLEARIGPEVTLSLRASGSDGEILEILNAIDFDLLNRLNETPARGIGSAAPRLTPEEQLAAGPAAGLAMIEREQIEGALAELRMQEAALDLRHRSNKMNGPDYDAAKAELEARRARLVAAAEEVARAATGAPPRPPADAGAGERDFAALAGHVLGLLQQAAGGGTAGAEAEAEAETAQAPAARAGHGISGGNCTTDGGFKRCRAGE